MSQEQLHRPEESTTMSEEQQTPVTLGDEATKSEQQSQHKPEAAVEESTITNEEHKPVPLGDESPISEEKPEAVAVPSSDVSTKNQEEQPHKSPVTYGDVFPAAAAEHGPLASEPITTEDAALMQTAEAMAFGHTLKGGAASAMQSAAARNVLDGSVAKDAHSRVSEYGLSVTETSVPGATMDIEYVAGQPVAASAHPTPTDPAIAALDAVTIGEALEAAAVGAGDRPVEESDARAIESAERRATGVSMPMKGGIGATAQSAAKLNETADENAKTTIADVLMDATGDLPMDKVVTYEDAYRVLQAELRGRSEEDLQPGGVGAMLAAAADLNEQSGLIPPYEGSIADERRQMDLEGEENDAVGDELHKYQKLEPSQSVDVTKQGESTKEEVTPLIHKEEQVPSVDSEELPTKQAESTMEEVTPLVHNSDEQVPSHGSEKLPAPNQPEV